jgi:hypothetical protein
VLGIEDSLQHPSKPFENFRFTADFPTAGRRELLLHGRTITSQGTQTGHLLLGVEDVTVQS